MGKVDKKSTITADPVFLILDKKDDTPISEDAFRYFLNKFLRDWGYRCVNVMDSKQIEIYVDGVREILKKYE